MKVSFQKYRQNFRTWRKQQKLNRELCSYQELFHSRRLTLPDEGMIRRTLQNKFPLLQRKKKGTLNILAIYHHYNWENYSLKPALEKFGRVLHYDWFEDFNHQEKDWHRFLKTKMNQDLVRRVEKWGSEDPFDVVFTYLSGEIVTPDTLQRISALRLPMINLSLNDKEAFVGRIRNGLATGSRDICRHFDLCWTSTRDSLEKYLVEGAFPVYLPEGANPDFHKPHDLPKTVDVSFVGQCYGNRPEIIQRLARKGFPVETRGEGWPEGPLSMEEMVRTYSRSRINLGFAGIAGYKDRFCLKGRDFEIPMSGGLYLTEYHPELENVYDVQNEIVTYSRFDDLLVKIQFLLANPEKAERIRQGGYQRARREHTWELRFEKVFSLIGLI